MAGFFKDNPAVTADAYTQDALTSKNEAEAAKVAAEAAKVAAEAAKLAAETAEANAETAEANAETAEANAETAANGISADAATATTKAAEAAASATNAAGSATTASTKAGEAATSATNAAGSATSATTSAATATTQAGNASASATSASSSASSATASQSAAETAKTAAEAAKSAAETAETNAASSQSAAATSASNAATSATNAASSATSANTAKTAAEAAKTAAETAETNAETAETNAETAETNAAASASAASTSASNAATSATSASNSATAASASESNVSSSATAAATSATNAATSASNAASSATSASNSAATATTQASTSTTQATNSASSATAASNSASSAASAQTAAESARDSALAALDSFDDRYLGTKSSAPSQDNDGNALVSGALYFDTNSNAMKVYDGSQWLNAYASLSGALIANQNLSDLNNASTARTNLGLGTAATTAASDYATAAQADQTVSLTGAGATTISGSYPNFTITSTDTNTDTNTTYSAGSGLSLSGTTFSNTAPDQTVSLTGSGATSVSGTYPNFTVSSTDTNTTYSVGDGGLTQNNFTTTLKNKLDGIEASADVTDTANVVSALTAGTNITIGANGTISASGGGVDGISSAATSNAMHIDSSGRIGFGTTNPSAWYYDDFVFTSGNAATSITIAGTNATGGESQIMFSDGSGSGSSSYTGFIKYGHNVSAGGSGPSLTTDWMALGVNAQQRVRIDNAGNVGIGNDYSPSEKLDVNGTVRATNYKIGSDQGTDGQVLTSTGSGVAWEAPAGPTGFSSTGDDVTISADADNNAGNSAIKFEIDGSEFARFSTQWDDGLIFGSTSIPTNGSIGGSELTLLRDGAYGVVSISNAEPNAVFGKPSSQNDVIHIKSGTTDVGAIGIIKDNTLTNRGMYLRGGVNTETVIRLEASTQALTPATQSGADYAARSSNSTDLGLSDARWKDFYLGNDISHRDSSGTARTLYDRSTDTLGNSSTNVTAATVDGTNFKVNGGQGSSGQVLTSSGSGVSWATPAAGGVTSFNVGGNQSGRYYSGLIDNTSASNFTLSTTPYYLPFIVYEDCTIDELSVVLNGGTGNSGDVAQIAVYGPVPANLGSTPHIVTSSTFAVDSGYGKTVAITATSFSAGIYLYSLVANTSSLVVRAQANNGKHINYMVGTGNASFPGGLYAAEWSGNTANTWPHSFPSSVSPSQMNHFSGNVPQFKYGVQ